MKEDGRPVGRPIDMTVPQYAIFVDEDNHRRTRVIVVQAEEAGDRKLLGYIEIQTGQAGIGTLTEFELLGRDIPPE